MAASYPGAIPTTPTRNDADMSAVVSHKTNHDRLWEEVRAICQTLGLSPSKSLTTVAASLVGWTTYTPVLGGSGWALGSGGSVAAFGVYHEANGLVHFHARLIFGTSGIGTSSNQPSVSLPSTSAESAGGLPDWNSVRCQYLDSSASVSYDGKGLLSGSVVLLGQTTVSSTYPTISLTSNSAPFTWNTSDEIRVSGWYRKT